MLDRTDYESWLQQIRLYCRGKENGLKILQSIDQGPFELGTTRDALGTTPEGGVVLGPERPRTYEDLSDTEKKRYDADVRATNIVLQGLPKDITRSSMHTLKKKHLGQRQIASCTRNGGAHNRAGNANTGQGKLVKCYNCNGVRHIVRNCTQPKHPQNSDYFKDKMLLMQAQENGVVLNEEELLFLAVSSVPSCASSALNSVCVSPVNDAIVPHDPIAIELKIYKEHVAIYEQRAKFELTEREQRMDDQMCRGGPDEGQTYGVVRLNGAWLSGRYPIDVEPISPRLKKNREVHLHYIKRLKKNVETLHEIVEDAKVKQTWKPTGKVFTTVGHHWKPTGRIFPLGTQCPLTRNTKPKVLPIKQWKPTGRLISLGGHCPLVRPTTLNNGIMLADPQEINTPVVQIVLWYLDSSCSKHMTGDHSRLRNFMKIFIGTVRFGNDHFGAIIGYGDYVLSHSVISRVYYVEGIGHNLFSVGQFYDADLEVALKNTHVSSEI
ncbi:hypothetical protein Tco_0098172 [Tanacetum coccineum]